MLNAKVGVTRVLARVRPTRSDRSHRPLPLRRPSVGVARRVAERVGSLAAAAHLAPRHRAPRRLPVTLRRALVVRFGSERALPLVVVLIVLIAGALSFGPTPAPVGAAQGAGTAPRIAIGGIGGETETDGGIDADVVGPQGIGYVDDGTVYKPVAVDTSVADGKDRLTLYTVQAGDTLTSIANHFGVSMMTIWWANNLTSKTSLKVGQQLVIPPVTGLVVTVREGDTLESLAAQYDITPEAIIDANGLEEPTLVIGQTLILPDAVGAPIPTATPKPVTRVARSTSTVSGPVAYGGGRFAWPVVGGNNYISQYFSYRHPAIDIAGDYGTPIVAAAAGTVLFAGWKSNGGGWQVWISHGSGIYTTYNHMSALTTSTGATVSRGQQVGRLGQSGWATGPHLHFEVWIGPIWNGGYRVNPLNYL